MEDRPLAGHEAAQPNAARKAMIDSQLRTSGVNAEFVLRRMAEVARERFVPDTARGFAYIDRAIAVGGGRYLAELLRPLVGSLEVISPEDAVTKSPRKAGDLTLLVIDGAIEELPESLVRRLADDARVVTGLMRNGLSRLAIGRKAAGQVVLLPLAELGIPALSEFAAPKGWSF